MPVTWRSEACDQGRDPESGAAIVRFTQAAKHSINIYCEQPYTSPDGRYIAVMRSDEADPRFAPHDLLTVDLATKRIQPLVRNARSYFIGTAAWSGILYYLSFEHELMRLDIATGELQFVWREWPFPEEFMLQSVSPDQRYLVGALPQASYLTAIIRIDLQERRWKVILERPEIFAAHLQYMPTAPGQPLTIMGLMNRGRQINDRWDARNYTVEHPGPCYYSVDNDGGNFRTFPSGEPVLPTNTGHSAWVAGTGRIAFSVSWNNDTWQLDSRWPQGNLFTAAAGEDQPEDFPAPEHRFNHVSVSRCGRYFVCESYPKGVPGPVPLVVGNFATGKYTNLVGDCKASSGGPTCSQPNAYFTADNKHVIYNADPFQLGQVFAASVPEGFLNSLD